MRSTVDQIQWTALLLLYVEYDRLHVLCTVTLRRSAISEFRITPKTSNSVLLNGQGLPVFVDPGGEYFVSLFVLNA